jgi:hypothetical protein
MRTIAQIISWLSLIGTLVPSIAYLAGSLTLDAMKTWMLVCTLIWFVTVPIWMDRAAKS